MGKLLELMEREGFKQKAGSFSVFDKNVGYLLTTEIKEEGLGTQQMTLTVIAKNILVGQSRGITVWYKDEPLGDDISSGAVRMNLEESAKLSCVCEDNCEDNN